MIRTTISKHMIVGVSCLGRRKFPSSYPGTNLNDTGSNFGLKRTATIRSWFLSDLFCSLQGLVSISTDGKFKSVPLETLVPVTAKHILLGLRPG
jgi:hypothetical protein